IGRNVLVDASREVRAVASDDEVGSQRGAVDDPIAGDHVAQSQRDAADIEADVGGSAQGRIGNAHRSDDHAVTAGVRNGAAVVENKVLVDSIGGSKHLKSSV